MMYTIYLYCNYENVHTYESGIVPIPGDLYSDLAGKGRSYIVKSRTLHTVNPSLITIILTEI